jgi:hypothetical protein
VFERVRQLTLKRRVERVVGHHYDIAELLPGVLDSLVNQRDLLAQPEAKPVRADDAQERREAKLPRFQDDDPPAPLPVDQVNDLGLLRARRKLDYRPVTRPD